MKYIIHQHGHGLPERKRDYSQVKGKKNFGNHELAHE